MRTAAIFLAGLSVAAAFTKSANNNVYHEDNHAAVDGHVNNGGGAKIGVVDHKVGGVDHKVGGVENEVPEVEQKVPEVEVEQKVPEVDQKVPEVDQKVPEVDQKVPEVDQKVPEVDQKAEGAKVVEIDLGKVMACFEECIVPYGTLDEFCADREKGRECSRKCQPYVPESLWHEAYRMQDEACAKNDHEEEWDAYDFYGAPEHGHNMARSYPNQRRSYDSYGSSYGYGNGYDDSYNYVKKNVHNHDGKRGGYDYACCSSATMTKAVGFLAPVVAVMAVGLGNGRL